MNDFYSIFFFAQLSYDYCALQTDLCNEFEMINQRNVKISWRWQSWLDKIVGGAGWWKRKTATTVTVPTNYSSHCRLNSFYLFVSQTYHFRRPYSFILYNPVSIQWIQYMNDKSISRTHRTHTHIQTARSRLSVIREKENRRSGLQKQKPMRANKSNGINRWRNENVNFYLYHTIPKVEIKTNSRQWG